MSSVLGWMHALCLFWIGSNNITEEDPIGMIVEEIVERVHAVDNECGAIVHPVVFEPRFYPNHILVSHGA